MVLFIFRDFEVAVGVVGAGILVIVEEEGLQAPRNKIGIKKHKNLIIGHLKWERRAELLLGPSFSEKFKSILFGSDNIYFTIITI